MRATFGRGRWVGIDDVGLPGPLYVRVRSDDEGRLRIEQMYIDASQSDVSLTQRQIRELPLSAIEGFINSNVDDVERSAKDPGPDLSTFATYFRKWVNPMNWDPDNAVWADHALMSQIPDQLAQFDKTAPRKAPRIRMNWRLADQDREYRLKPGANDDGLTAEFLRDVARAYMAALARGERPNVSIAEQTQCSVKTVRRWVLTARSEKYKLLPPGRQGQAG